MSYNCEVKEQMAQPTLSIRTKTSVEKLPQVLGKALSDIAQYLEEVGEEPAGPPYVAYYNMNMKKLDLEIGFPVSKKIVGKGDIKASEIPAGNTARCLYVGPYNKISPAYNALSKWIKDHGYKIKGVSYEIYLNDPNQTPPEELMTEIVFPLK